MIVFLLRAFTLFYVPYTLGKMLFNKEVVMLQILIAFLCAVFTAVDYARAYYFTMKEIRNEKNNTNRR